MLLIVHGPDDDALGTHPPQSQSDDRRVHVAPSSADECCFIILTHIYYYIHYRYTAGIYQYRNGKNLCILYDAVADAPSPPPPYARVNVVVG